MLRKAADLVVAAESLWLAAGLVLGVGLIGFVAETWTLHFLSTNNFVLAAATVASTAVVGTAALLRVPLAVFTCLAGAAVLGVAFATGTLALLLPPR